MTVIIEHRKNPERVAEVERAGLRLGLQLLEWPQRCEGVGSRLSNYFVDVRRVNPERSDRILRRVVAGRSPCAEDVGGRASAAWNAVGRWRFTIAARYSIVGVGCCVAGDRARLN
jgi:hypothetical protein